MGRLLTASKICYANLPFAVLGKNRTMLPVSTIAREGFIVYTFPARSCNGLILELNFKL